MDPQIYNWTCSICSFAWSMGAIGSPISREEATNIIGYPACVNETYGLMSADCLISAYAKLGIIARQAWVTFEQAYSICQHYTGVINPLGQYHFMGIRGVESGTIWVANSAQGYMGVWDNLDYEKFISLGPVQVIYCESYSS